MACMLCRTEAATLSAHGDFFEETPFNGNGMT
jgi:hypothetical protein